MKLLLSWFCVLLPMVCLSQQTDIVDFKRAKANLKIHPYEKEVQGEMLFELDIIQPTDSIFLDAQNMNFENVLFNNGSVQWYNDDKKLWLIHSFKPSKYNQITFTYHTKPKKALYFVGWDTSNSLSVTNVEKQVWTQGQGKYSSNWLPSIDNMNDKIEFDLSITFDKDYEVISNGKLTNKRINDSTTTWHYDMQEPMASYLVALAIGKYDKKTIQSQSGVPIELYYYPEDSLKFEPTFRYTKEIFDFLEEEIGVPYPWQNYKQVPVKDFLYAGMENTSLTIFSDRYVVDSTAFVDRNYVNVNAHELAHQWFGNLVTETSGAHHWLQEGFATYYALLAEKQIFGEDHYRWQLYEYAQELLEQDKAGGSTFLLDPKSSSTTFYKKGAWVLHLLREKVGDEPFRKAVKSYLENHQYKNVDTEDFISEVEKASRQDLKDFVDKWLEDKMLYYEDMINNLRSNSLLIDQYLKYDCSVTPEVCKLFLLNQNLSDYNSKIIKDMGQANISKSTFLTDDVKARKAIAQTIYEIPLEIKKDYENLLNDPSYLTIELALLNLWKNFPEDRNIYLEQTKNIIGFNDKNVRILWLTLALITEDYQPENKQEFYKELVNYTNPNYHFEIRQNAFQYLKSIGACNDLCIENLELATKHPVWQFSKMAKEVLNQIEQ